MELSNDIHSEFSFWNVNGVCIYATIIMMPSENFASFLSSFPSCELMKRKHFQFLLHVLSSLSFHSHTAYTAECIFQFHLLFQHPSRCQNFLAVYPDKTWNYGRTTVEKEGARGRDESERSRTSTEFQTIRLWACVLINMASNSGWSNCAQYIRHS